MNVTVTTVHRLTAELDRAERPVIGIGFPGAGSAHLMVTGVTLEVTGDDPQAILGLITVWGHWLEGPSRPASTQLDPASVPPALAPVIGRMLQGVSH